MRNLKKKHILRKILFFSFILVLIGSFVWGESGKFQIYIFGGINRVFEYGSENDYVMGKNDFPITPSHTPSSFGASIGYFFADNIGIELDGRLCLDVLIFDDPDNINSFNIMAGVFLKF